MYGVSSPTTYASKLSWKTIELCYRQGLVLFNKLILGYVSSLVIKLQGYHPQSRSLKPQTNHVDWNAKISQWEWISPYFTDSCMLIMYSVLRRDKSCRMHSFVAFPIGPTAAGLTRLDKFLVWWIKQKWGKSTTAYGVLRTEYPIRNWVRRIVDNGRCTDSVQGGHLDDRS